MSDTSTTAVTLVIGAGGHARVLLDALLQGGERVDGFLDSGMKTGADVAGGVRVLGDDRYLEAQDPGSLLLVNGLGSVASTQGRREVYRRCRELGFRFRQVVHPSAVISPAAVLADGAQVLAGTVVGPGAVVGENAIINNRACVDHDCVIGAHAHVAPGVTLSGNVVVEDGAHLGTGAVVVQGCRIGGGALIAAGSIVYRDVPAGMRLVQPRTWGRDR